MKAITGLTESEKFDAVLSKVLSVSHDELKRWESEWKKRKKRKRKKKTAESVNRWQSNYQTDSTYVSLSRKLGQYPFFRVSGPKISATS